MNFLFLVMQQPDLDHLSAYASAVRDDSNNISVLVYQKRLRTALVRKYFSIDDVIHIEKMYPYYAKLLWPIFLIRSWTKQRLKTLLLSEKQKTLYWYLLGVFYYLINSLFLMYSMLIARSSYGERVVKKFCPDIIFHDHTEPQFWIKSIYNSAKKNNITTVGLPHSVRLIERIDSSTSNNYFWDRYVAVNELQLNSLVSTGVPSERIKILGSLRFSMSRINFILNKFQGSYKKESHLRLLFILHSHRNVDSNELAYLSQYLKSLSKIDGVHVIVKLHTRRSRPFKELDSGECRDFTIASKSSSTTDLINWASHVFCITGSAPIDAMLLEKPLYVLSFMIQSGFPIYADNVVACSLAGRGEFEDVVACIIKGQDGYKPNYASFLSEYVWAGLDSGEKARLNFKKYVYEIG